MAQQPEAVLFDLGNVIIQVHFERCFAIWGKAIGKTPAEVAALYKFDDAYCAHELAAITVEEYHAHVAKLLGADLSFPDFVIGWMAILGDVIEETRQLILDLKKHYKLYVLTNSNVIHREVWSVQHRELLVHFDHVFCSSVIKERKPDAACFQAICTAVNLTPGQILFTDDLLTNIVAAQKFGLQTMLFDDPPMVVAKLRRRLLR